MTLYDNEREDHPTPIPIPLRTRVPSKWRLVDMETNEVWFYDGERFRAAHDITVLHRGITLIREVSWLRLGAR